MFIPATVSFDKAGACPARQHDLHEDKDVRWETQTAHTIDPGKGEGSGRWSGMMSPLFNYEKNSQRLRAGGLRMGLQCNE